MTKTIGFVCEGPRDSDLFSSVIDHLFPDYDIEYRYIQPEESLISQYAAGWKGVWRWCYENGKIIDSFLTEMSPPLDAIIIHLDGDVSRTEKSSHCECNTVVCEYHNEDIPPNCKHPHECPISLPCKHHDPPSAGYVEHLHNLISSLLPSEHQIPIILVFPCDSSDTWIVASLDDYPDYELLQDPWHTIISRPKKYHGVRVRSGPKNARTYGELITLMLNNWDRVTANCQQAAKFQRDLTDLLIEEDG